MSEAIEELGSWFGWVGSKMHYRRMIVTEGRDDPLYVAFCGQSKELSRITLQVIEVYNSDEQCGNCNAARDAGHKHFYQSTMEKKGESQ